MFAFDAAMVRRNTITHPACAQAGRNPPGSRAGLPASSALAGGTPRGLVIATGLAATVPMLAPSGAAAQFVCRGGQAGPIFAR